MTIKAKSQPVADISPRPRTRVPVSIVTPPSPPPTTGTWVLDIHVRDATVMHGRAVDVMLAAKKTPAEINARLCVGEGADAVVDISECLKVLFEFTYRSIENLTECKVDEPRLYLEPLAAGAS